MQHIRAVKHEIRLNGERCLQLKPLLHHIHIMVKLQNPKVSFNRNGSDSELNSIWIGEACGDDRTNGACIEYYYYYSVVGSSHTTIRHVSVTIFQFAPTIKRTKSIKEGT